MGADDPSSSSSNGVAVDPATSLTKTILNNLVSEPSNPKFKRIRLDGKAGAKLLAAPSSIDLLKSLGFVEEQGDQGRFLVVETVDTSAASSALAKMSPKKKEEKLSLKQQARRDAEARRVLELQEAKRLREETKKQIQRDNRARKEDPNWKPSAVVKGGKDINTFRGKYGEEGKGG